MQFYIVLNNIKNRLYELYDDECSINEGSITYTELYQLIDSLNFLEKLYNAKKF